MTLAKFAVACAASTKWVQNVARLQGRPFAYTAEEAKHVGLVHQLQADLRVPLDVADRIAARTLADGASASGESSVRLGGVTRVTVDVARYLSDFSVRLARAYSQHAPRRRGRKGRRPGSAVARAREYGLDIGLLRASLRSSPDERIRRLDGNMALVRALRARR